MTPDADVHVAVALLCVFVAFFIVFLVAMIPIEDDPVRRRQNRKE
ncbi:MAG TPA: hypothetical protein VGR45_10360 [Stellaceae bacterium]|nr:hypothetical protein [Stellaceae bacterium]